MELDNTIQISSEYLQSQYFDSIIVVSNFESRSSFLTSKMDVEKIPSRRVLAFKEHENISSCAPNDDKFHQLNFSFHKTSISDTSSLSSFFENICDDNSKKNINILIDFTCMPKVWYSGIINYFSTLECELANLTLWFSYSPSDYQKPTSASCKVLKENMPKVTGNKPIALIAGLGADKDCAADVLAALKPDVSYAYIASSDIDNRYTADVVSKNEKLIKRIAPDKVIQYPLLDMNNLCNALTNNSVNLRMNYDVVLVPIGPKPFSLMCSVLSARYPDIHVWNIPSETSSRPVDRKPYGEIVLYKVAFTSEEVDY